jgi:hypothetical protein
MRHAAMSSYDIDMRHAAVNSNDIDMRPQHAAMSYLYRYEAATRSYDMW